MSIDKLREGQKEYLKDCLNEIQEKPTTEEKMLSLHSMFKSEARTIQSTLSTVLNVFFAIALIVLFINGQFNATEVKVEIGCDGKPVNDSFMLVKDQSGKLVDVLENNESLMGKTYGVQNGR